jgi:hypothetical protein
MKLGAFGSSLCRVSKNGTFVNTYGVSVSKLAEYDYWNCSPIDLAIMDYGYSFLNNRLIHKAENIYGIISTHRVPGSSRTIFDWSVCTRFNNKKHVGNKLLHIMNKVSYEEGDY